MNTVSRGVRNAFRNTIRTGSIVIILALSIGLIIAMMAARQAVTDKIATIKASSGNTITISPAGVRGFEGGGTALTEDDLASITDFEHVTNVSETLNARLTSDDSSLESAIEAGDLGQRNADSSGIAPTMPSGGMPSDDSSDSERMSFTPPITVTGINDANAINADDTTANFTSGELFDVSTSEAVAVIGKSLAEENDLSVGSTFTAYDTEFTVVGIFDTGNTFSNGGLYMPLATLQAVSDQSGSITSATVTIDSSDNLDAVTTAIEDELGSAADVTNSQTIAEATTEPLESVANIALFSLIGALIAGAVIILLTMLMIVRERRREIGVMKAIGASNVAVMWQFVVESLTLTVMGLVIGVLIGIAAATPLTSALVDSSSSSSTTTTQSGPGMRGGPGRMSQFSSAASQTVESIQTSVGANTLAYGVVGALLIAILGSAIPALMISKIKPADAMRNE